MITPHTRPCAALPCIRMNASSMKRKRDLPLTSLKIGSSSTLLSRPRSFLVSSSIRHVLPRQQLKHKMSFLLFLKALAMTQGVERADKEAAIANRCLKWEPARVIENDHVQTSLSLSLTPPRFCHHRRRRGPRSSRRSSPRMSAACSSGRAAGTSSSSRSRHRRKAQTSPRKEPQR